jgi:predicted secreted protein
VHRLEFYAACASLAAGARSALHNMAAIAAQLRMRFEIVATMSLATSIAIYFIIWWVVLFAVLPWGVRSQEEQGTITPGSDPGAPAIPNLKRKLVWTTIVAAVMFAMWHVIYTYRLIALDDLAALLGVPR